MNTEEVQKYSKYIQIEVGYLSRIIVIIEKMVAEILIHVDFNKKETCIYSVSNNDGLCLKIYIIPFEIA